MTAHAVAYCGTPAVPADIWTSWNPDPFVIIGLIALAGAVHYDSKGPARRAGFAAVALLAIIFLSPLCALSAALFSARVVHHVLLIAGVAPLLAFAFASRKALPIGALFGLHLGVLWVWHVPSVYDWAIGSMAGYWLMQSSLLAASVVFWREVLSPGSEPVARIAALLGTVAQMGLLGALIAFAPRALYDAHFTTTLVWGLNPLEDQQLAGLIMWVPAILPYLAAALFIGIARLLPPTATR